MLVSSSVWQDINSEAEGPRVPSDSTIGTLWFSQQYIMPGVGDFDVHRQPSKKPLSYVKNLLDINGIDYILFNDPITFAHIAGLKGE